MIFTWIDLPSDGSSAPLHDSPSYVHYGLTTVYNIHIWCNFAVAVTAGVSQKCVHICYNMKCECFLFLYSCKSLAKIYSGTIKISVRFIARKRKLGSQKISRSHCCSYVTFNMDTIVAKYVFKLIKWQQLNNF